MVEYASGLTVFCQSSQIAQLVEVLALNCADCVQHNCCS